MSDTMFQACRKMRMQLQSGRSCTGFGELDMWFASFCSKGLAFDVQDTTIERLIESPCTS